MIHARITFQLDYCKALYVGLSSTISHLQLISKKCCSKTSNGYQEKRRYQPCSHFQLLTELNLIFCCMFIRSCMVKPQSTLLISFNHTLYLGLSSNQLLSILHSCLKTKGDLICSCAPQVVECTSLLC